MEELRSEPKTDSVIAKVAERYSRKMVDGRAAAEIASKQKHSPAREHLVASSIVSADLVSGDSEGTGPVDTGPARSGTDLHVLVIADQIRSPMFQIST